MARKHRHEEHENHERWLVSYADFITLLFAFFVVMYSISSVNEGKFRVLANSLIAAFRDPTRSLEPIQVGKLVRAPNIQRTSILQAPVPLDRPSLSSHEPGRKQGEGIGDTATPRGLVMADLDKIAARIRHAMTPLIDQDLVEVRRSAHWLEVEIKTSILFASGSARLEQTALAVLEKLAEILRGFPNPIEVEGFTDNLPISTPAFPSNWELSAARAASVVHLFMNQGVRPGRMAAIGYGEHRPIADNDTPEGRNRNRRVVIVILMKDYPRSKQRFTGLAGNLDVDQKPPPEELESGKRPPDPAPR